MKSNNMVLFYPPLALMSRHLILQVSEAKIICKRTLSFDHSGGLNKERFTGNVTENVDTLVIFSEFYSMICEISVLPDFPFLFFAQ